MKTTTTTYEHQSDEPGWGFVCFLLLFIYVLVLYVLFKYLAPATFVEKVIAVLVSIALYYPLCIYHNHVTKITKTEEEG